jgi:hypothetical protein
MSEDIGEISWNESLEEYFKKTGEKAHCLSWCHKQAENVYSHRRTFVDLPVIVLSSITGFCSVGSSLMFEGQEKASAIALGVASLFVSVINGVGSYFGWAKRAEGHRISAIQYSRLFRFLAIEMGLPREERMNPKDLLKHTKDNIDRLQEISPSVPNEVRREFQSKFSKYKDIAFPEEVNGLERISVFRDKEYHLEIEMNLPPLSPNLRKSSSSESLAQSPPVSSLKSLKRQSVKETDKSVNERPLKQIEEGVIVPASDALTIVQPKDTLEMKLPHQLEEAS